MNIECKLRLSVRLAREARRDSWQRGKATRKAYKLISKEAMEDARYWRSLR